jgi:hypothetical protein
MRPTAHVYVDGFNLYNGLKRRAEEKGVPEIEYRWLDLVKLARTLLPHADIRCLYYFTSTVKRRIGNPGAADRQEIFIRALERLPEVEVVKGKFHSIRVRGEVVGDPERTEVVRSYKEKRSDVNLATYLLRDAYEKRCQLAAVISADSDLVAPIRTAHLKLPFGVVVLNPNVAQSRHLGKVARQIVIPEAALRISQLPVAVQDKEGRETRRPPSW